MADWTGLDRRTIRKRLEQVPSKPGPNRALLFDSRSALPLLYGIGTADDARLDPSAEKARLDAARADLAEIERDKKRGALVEADEVAEAWGNQIQIAKGRLLSLPPRLAPDLARVTDQRAAERLLRKAITEVLHELADGADK